MVALVRGVHGLRGAVRVEVLTDHPAQRYAPGTILHREGDETPLTIASAEAVADGPGWRLRFREITDRAAADALRGAYLEAVRYPQQDLGRGEYYWHEVIGCAVHGVDGAELGTVRDVYRVGETEVFEVAGGPFGAWDLPAVRAFIRVFAPRRGEIVVDADALDLRPVREASTDPDRPRAPRRRTRRPAAAAGAAAGSDAIGGAAPSEAAPDGTARAGAGADTGAPTDGAAGGDPGTAGEPGAAADEGATGDTGAAREPGAAGDEGATGDTGAAREPDPASS